MADVAHARSAIKERSVEAAFLVGPATTDELIVATAPVPKQSALACSAIPGL